MADPKDGGGGGLGVFGLFFLQKRSLLARISIKQVRNLSQNAGNSHFRDSNFQTFLEGMPPNIPTNLAPSALVGASPLLKILDPPLNRTKRYKKTSNNKLSG